MGYIRGSYYNIPKAIFYLLKGDYRGKNLGLTVLGRRVGNMEGTY